MTLPTMTPGNNDRKILARLEKLEVAFREFAAATGTLGSATIDKGDLRAVGGRISSIDPASGAAAWLLSSILRLSPDETDPTIAPAIIAVDPGSSYRALRLIPPVTAGEDAGANAITIIGRGGDDPARVVIEGDAIDLVTGGLLRLYELPTTGSAANIRYDSGTATVQWVTSSLRYKSDPQDAVVDAAEVLQMSGRTWVDKGTVERLEAAGEDTSTVARNIGFIAEELHALPSLRQFVDYDDQGRPDAIQYDRLTVALLELAKTQHKQIDQLAVRLDALESTHPESEEVS